MRKGRPANRPGGVALTSVTNELSGLAVQKRIPTKQELSLRVFVKDAGVRQIAAFHNGVVAPSRQLGNLSKDPTASLSCKDRRTDRPSPRKPILYQSVDSMR
jgi:hypothetical protein